MGKTKDRLYYYLVEKNPRIKEEYQGYVNSHQEEHHSHRGKSWFLLIRLNWHYRIIRSKKPLLNKSTSAKQQPVNKPRLPYMNGAESERLKRPEPFHLAKILLDYDVISFDIFDTLILRPFQKPVDLFPIIGYRHRFSGFNRTFTAIRRQSETEAREYARVMEHNPEINIFQIYDVMAKYTDIPADKGVETEFQAEMDYCFANPYMLQVFKILRSQGKKIIIASDMYFPEEYLKKLLEKNGYTGYDKLYVSCDYKACKGTGELYKIILKDYPDIAPEKIIQVGDNRHSDVDMARSNGLSAFHYQNVQEAGEKYRADGMSPIVGSYYAGIVNTHLYNGTKKYPFYYEYGFTYMGLYIYGMCRWIHEKALREGIDKIIFLSRDGYIYRNVFNMFYHDVDNCYEFWSRSAAMRYSVAKRNYLEFIDRYVDLRAIDSNKDGVHVLVVDLLTSLEIRELSNDLYKFGLQPGDIVSVRNKDSIKNFVWEHKEYILEKYARSEAYIHSAFRKAIGNAKTVALIDVGWTGHNLLNLKNVIQKDMGIDCDIKVWMAAEKNGVNNAELLENSLDAYLFTSFINYDLPGTYHNSKNSMINTPFFEVGTQPAHPSFIAVNDNGEYEFDTPIVEDYEISRLLEQGIVDFCRLYHNKCKTDPYIRNVPGKDAYRPFTMTVRGITFIKNNFQNIHICMNIGSNSSTQRVESIGQQLQTHEINRNIGR